VRRKLRAAWAKPTVAEARADLQALARGLARRRPGAAASLREGLDETLTVTRLGVTGSLLKTLASTNPVESMIEIIRDHAHRVKHWSSGDMALRWAAAGMTAAQAQFRRVKGHRQLPQLAHASSAPSATSRPRPTSPTPRRPDPTMHHSTEATHRSSTTPGASSPQRLAPL
jgi:putative transposase